MTVKEFLENIGLKPETELGTQEEAKEKTPEQKKIEELEEEILKLKKGSAVEPPSESNIKEQDTEIGKMREEINAIKEMNRALLLGMQAEPEKSIEENIHNLCNYSVGGNEDGSNNTR